MTQASQLIAKQYTEAGLNKKNWGAVAYNVLVEGLVGDGVTDDTAALQALINTAIAADRRTILFPHGTYYVTALANDDQVDFVGDNSTFTGGYTGTITNLGDLATIIADLAAHEADYAKEVAQVFNVVGYGAVGDGVADDYAAIKAAYDAATEGSILFIPDLMFNMSETLFVDKSIHIMGSHAEEDPTKSATLRKTADFAVIHIRHRGVRVSNLHISSSIADTTQGIIIGSITTQAQNVVFDNVYVKGAGSHGIWLQNANNCKLNFSVINNGGYGYYHNPVDLNSPNGVYNASGNIIECVNCFGNDMGGVYMSHCEGNQVFLTSQSNTGYGFEGVSIWGCLITGYTELNTLGSMSFSGNSSGNQVWVRGYEGIKLNGIGIDGTNRGEDPNFTEFFLEAIGQGTTQQRFIMPRFLMLPQYQMPKYPENGELVYGSTTTYGAERTLRMFDAISWKTIATREYVDRGGRSGTTANRPTDVRAGKSMYFDTTLNKPVWCKTGSATWVTFTITAAATTSGNLTLTIDGTAVIVPVLVGDTIAMIAKKIAQFGAAGWLANGASTKVDFESIAVGDRTGTNSFSGGTTGVTATVAKIITGTGAVWVDATGTTV